VHKEALDLCRNVLKHETGLLWQAWNVVLFGNSLFSVDSLRLDGEHRMPILCFFSQVFTEKLAY